MLAARCEAADMNCVGWHIYATWLNYLLVVRRISEDRVQNKLTLTQCDPMPIASCMERYFSADIAQFFKHADSDLTLIGIASHYDQLEVCMINVKPPNIFISPVLIL